MWGSIPSLGRPGLRAPYSLTGVDDLHGRVGGRQPVHPDPLEGDPDAEIDPGRGEADHLSRCRLIGGRALPGTDHDGDRNPLAGHPFGEVLLGQDTDEDRQSFRLRLSREEERERVIARARKATPPFFISVPVLSLNARRETPLFQSFSLML